MAKRCLGPAKTAAAHVEPVEANATTVRTETALSTEMAEAMETSETTETAVEEVVADVVTAVAASEVQMPAGVSSSAHAVLWRPRTSKQPMHVTESSRKRLRSVVQDDDESVDAGEEPVDRSMDAGDVVTPGYLPVACTVDGDPNIMATGPRSALGSGLTKNWS
ncbi:hypothetical protein PC118_g6036 [Phytophthora cactorum]|nr:hypothetical protein PC115_g1657 [Phytophthora cactorum]KAG2989639.1 hypothetical protein PC118_g6036 [Phytophthora cactorum]